jgi:xylan 1,4-beta-xylosidase
VKIALPLALVLASVRAGAGDASPVLFDWFEYTGRDAAFAAPPAPGEYRNPVLAGFHPDPSICRVGDDYYVVNSTFAYFPGIPVYHSRDLVNWKQVGNVVSRPSQLNYDGLGVSRGIFAPALSHHGDTFYLVCTFVDAGGNFVMTAKDPAGPWSDPVWLGFDGIDPSLFFDDDGRAWIVNNGPPPENKSLYNGHRAIWMQEFDPVARKLVGPREIKVNGGAAIEKHPVWIEGPHLFKKDGWYYLMCAEGGTAEEHSEVIFRSHSVRGPYVPGPSNPILTQRDLAPDRPDPVTCTGHAELVEAPGGDWWAVFLGCRPYAGTFYNTGRETFMLPVSWKDGWPVILPHGQAVPYAVHGPAPSMAPAGNEEPLTGNFTWRDTFEEKVLSPSWLMLRQPHAAWHSVGSPVAGLYVLPRAEALSGKGNPSFLARRVQHARFDATVEVEVPSEGGVAAGVALFQSEDHYCYLYVSRPTEAGDPVVTFETATSDGWLSGVHAPVAASASSVLLRITCEDAVLKLRYSAKPGTWEQVGGDLDATLFSTKTAGGFVGAMVGPCARTGTAAVSGQR